MTAPTILLSGVRPAVQVRLRAAFPDVDLVPLADGTAQVQPGGTTAAVVGLDADLERGFRGVRELAAAGARVVVLGPTKDPDLILRAMRAGAKEFVLAGEEDELVRALRDQVRPGRAANGGLVCSVVAAKGGVGATTLATNLAGALQRGGKRTCLVDLNLTMGDVLAFLDLQGGYSIADVIANMRRLDRDLLDSTLLKHASGFHVLAQSHRMEDAERVAPDLLAAMFRFLRQQYGAVVIDGVRTFDDLGVAAIDASDQVLLVVTPEVPAVRDARRCMQLIRRLGAEGKVKLVLNRFEKGVEITPEVVADTVGVPVAVTIGSDYAAVIRAVNKGQLLHDEAPRSPVTRGFEQVLAAVAPRTAPEARTKPSLLDRFLHVRASHATE